MSILKGTSKADLATGPAQQAWDNGSTVFLFEAGSSFRDAVKGVAEAIEAVEGIGWRLQHMSHVWSSSGGNHAIGYYLFRR
jgi:hypothetical protein